MHISAHAALWFLPFVVPLCFYTCFTDLKEMRITNQTVIALALVFASVGVFVLPLDIYLWRYMHLLVVLVIGMALNAGGVMGAGDAKFLAAAAPFVHLGDLQFMLFLFSGTLLAAVVVHKAAKYSPLRRLAPGWKSWDSGSKFPMGLALGTTLVLYLAIGALYGR